MLTTGCTSLILHQNVTLKRHRQSEALLTLSLTLTLTLTQAVGGAHAVKVEQEQLLVSRFLVQLDMVGKSEQLVKVFEDYCSPNPNPNWMSRFLKTTAVLTLTLIGCQGF